MRKNKKISEVILKKLNSEKRIKERLKQKLINEKTKPQLLINSKSKYLEKLEESRGIFGNSLNKEKI